MPSETGYQEEIVGGTGHQPFLRLNLHNRASVPFGKSWRTCIVLLGQGLTTGWVAFKKLHPGALSPGEAWQTPSPPAPPRQAVCVNGE